MKFEDLNTNEKADICDLLCLLSAKVNKLDDDPSMIPERTEEEILQNLSENACGHWEEYLLSKVS